MEKIDRRKFCKFGILGAAAAALPVFKFKEEIFDLFFEKRKLQKYPNLQIPRGYEVRDYAEIMHPEHKAHEKLTKLVGDDGFFVHNFYIFSDAMRPNLPNGVAVIMPGNEVLFKKCNWATANATKMNVDFLQNIATKEENSYREIAAGKFINVDKLQRSEQCLNENLGAVMIQKIGNQSNFYNDYFADLSQLQCAIPDDRDSNVFHCIVKFGRQPNQAAAAQYRKIEIDENIPANEKAPIFARALFDIYQKHLPEFEQSLET